MFPCTSACAISHSVIKKPLLETPVSLLFIQYKGSTDLKISTASSTNLFLSHSHVLNTKTAVIRRGFLFLLKWLQTIQTTVILVGTPRRDQSGRGSSFLVWPLEDTISMPNRSRLPTNHESVFFSSSATQNETLVAKLTGSLSWTPYVWPKSVTYTPEREDEHLFNMGVPLPASSTQRSLS